MCFVFGYTQAQKEGINEEEKELLKKKYQGYYITTYPTENVVLDTLTIFPKPKFKTSYDRRYYYWFKKKTYTAYPYAVLFKDKMNGLNDSIATIKSKRKRKRYIRKKQKFFEEQFAENVKDLTRTEGRILIKLIHRLTGFTVNEHVQDKRGKFRAFIYRSSAKIFKIKLDLEYHPETLMEDYLIESILQEAFARERLEEYPSLLKSANYIYTSKTIEIKKKK